MAENIPSTSKYVTSSMVTLFKDTIDQLLTDMGRVVTLYLPPTIAECPNCGVGFNGTSNGIYNASNANTLGGALHKRFPNGGICPVCKGKHKIETANTVQYTANIGRAPKDIDFDATGINPENVVKTKMQLCAFNDLMACEKALIDGDLYVRLRDPVKTGLKVLNYVVCWWKKIE